MIKRLSISIFISFVLFSFYSCKQSVNSKQAYLKEYKGFIEEVKKKQDHYTEEDWQKKDKEFEHLSNELFNKFEDDMGFMEKAKIGTYAITYGSLRAVNALTAVIESEDLEESIEDLKKVWNDDIKIELEENLDEIKLKLEDEEFREELNVQLDKFRDLAEDEEVKAKLEEVMVAIEDFVNEIERKSR